MLSRGARRRPLSIASKLASPSYGNFAAQSNSSNLTDRHDPALHLFAGFCGLAVLMLIVRFTILKHPPLRQYFPILVYQDLITCAVVAWLFYFALVASQHSFMRHIVIALGWSICVILTGYTALSAVIYTVIHAPVTYSLWLAGDHLRGARTSVATSFSTSSLLIFIKAFVIFLGVTEGLWRLAPYLVKKAAKRFYSPITALVLATYFILAHFWTINHVRYLPAVANPELALVSSFFAPLDPFVTDIVPKKYFDEFANVRRSDDRAGSGLRLAASYSPIHSPAEWHPRNILMVIMESVGSRRLQIYNAPYSDTPEMERLAQHAMIFDRMYVAQAYTSGAMSAIFCSLSPQLGWQPITRSQPNIDVPGIADVLNQHGYATAFMFPGELDFDHEGDFLADHGFRDLFLKQDDVDRPTNGDLLKNATSWIHTHSNKPFFLALWTEDTHHPYFAADSQDYKVSDGNLNRYLNAIHSTDQLIGGLVETLDQMKISDNTLVVITGDHGEAFGEHDQTAHNWTVYDEEMRIPLILINRRLFPHGQRVDHLGRQIDISPTLLALLGYPQPSSWQGESLFSMKLVDHAYLFSRYGNYTFGLVDDHSKYVYDFNRRRAEYYDLASDPREKHDLGPELVNSAILKTDRLKVEAWMLYQRDYLKRYYVTASPSPRESHPGLVAQKTSLTIDPQSNPAGQAVAQKSP